MTTAETVPGAHDPSGQSVRPRSLDGQRVGMEADARLSGAERSERCVCGGVIKALDAEDIPLAVQRHQQTDRHIAYTYGQPVPCPGDGERGCLAWIYPWRSMCQFDERTVRMRQVVQAA